VGRTNAQHDSRIHGDDAQASVLVDVVELVEDKQGAEPIRITDRLFTKRLFLGLVDGERVDQEVKATAQTVERVPDHDGKA